MARAWAAWQTVGHRHLCAWFPAVSLHARVNVLAEYHPVEVVPCTPGRVGARTCHYPRSSCHTAPLSGVTTSGRHMDILAALPSLFVLQHNMAGLCGSTPPALGSSPSDGSLASWTYPSHSRRLSKLWFLATAALLAPA